MANRKKKQRSLVSVLEELDRPLYEGKWQEIDYALKKLSKKGQVSPGLGLFVKALQQIESFTLEQVQDHRTALTEAYELLKKAYDSCHTEEYALLRVMIKIKQGQIAWIRNETMNALNKFPQGISARRVDKVPIHTTKVFMEAYLYTGLCNEILYSDRVDKFSLAANAYEECLRLALEIIAIARSSGFSVHPSVFKAIRTSLERGPILCMKMRNPNRAIGFFRRVLLAKEDLVMPQVRLISATSLTVSLIFLLSPSAYFPFTFSQSSYSPSQLSEEAILTSSLSQSILGSLRDIKSRDALAIFDIMTLVLTDAKLPSLLVQTLEESMSFTAKSPHLWIQFGLALVNSNLLQQAEAVFHECIRIYPKDVSVVLFGANFVLESMCNPELSLKWAKQAIEISEGHYLEPKLYHLLGKAQSALANKELTFEKRQVQSKESLQYFKKAAELDPQSVEFIFYYALQLAQRREISAARENIQQALTLEHSNVNCLHLLALLLTSDKQYTEALQICDLALRENMDNLSLIRTKVLLLLVENDVHQALQSCKQALKAWQNLYPEEISGLISAVTQDTQSLSDLPLRSLERDEHSFNYNADIASDAGSSHFSMSYYSSVNPSSIMQAQIWCMVAEVFIKGEKKSDANLCVQEAQMLASYLPAVSVTHAKSLENENQLQIALDQYNNALVLQPYNSMTLTHVGRVLHIQGEHEEAEKHLREAISVDRFNHEAWFWLGKVFAAQKEFDHSADCFKTSLQFESTAPIQSFTAALSEQLVI